MECPTPLPDFWIEYTNSHKNNGIANSDSDLDSCQMTCIGNSNCTSLDWSTRDPPGRRCWLHGPWSSSESRRSATGVTHYELRRTAIANWVKYSDMHVNGGIATNSMDLAGCQQDCVNNASCTRLDWSASASSGQRCWIHGPWSYSQSRRSTQNIDHFELYRGNDGFCGERHRPYTQLHYSVATLSLKFKGHVLGSVTHRLYIFTMNTVLVSPQTVLVFANFLSCHNFRPSHLFKRTEQSVAALHQGVSGQMTWLIAEELLPWLTQISMNFINIAHKQSNSCATKCKSRSILA